ncbi:hypothetical protein BD309DRAFT_960053 [Dichomitus squalens]|nr:hypothetical protein BD309DRAFT_960053 [Dichomitus squalens]
MFPLEHLTAVAQYWRRPSARTHIIPSSERTRCQGSADGAAIHKLQGGGLQIADFPGLASFPNMCFIEGGCYASAGNRDSQSPLHSRLGRLGCSMRMIKVQWVPPSGTHPEQYTEG